MSIIINHSIILVDAQSFPPEQSAAPLQITPRDRLLLRLLLPPLPLPLPRHRPLLRARQLARTHLRPQPRTKGRGGRRHHRDRTGSDGRVDLRVHHRVGSQMQERQSGLRAGLVLRDADHHAGTCPVSENLELFPFPHNVVWHDPGFFSLTVPYDPTRDFFFSGHTGTLSIILLELFTLRYKWMTLAALVSLIYMMNMLTITRVHYTVDIAGGLIFSFFAHKMVGKIVFYGDWLLSVPFMLVRRARERRGKQVGGGEAVNASLEDRLVTTQN